MGNAFQYVPEAELYDVARSAPSCVAYLFRNKIRTVRLGNTYLKKKFALEDELSTLVAEVRAAGGKGYPSSWADVYKRVFPIERAPHPIRAIFANKRIRGAWEEARITGQLIGSWRVYDIRSAYASAALRGLPDSKTFRLSEKIEPGGFYVASWESATAPAPAFFQRGRSSLCTAQEVERYDLRGVVVHRGVTFDRLRFDVGSNLERIRRSFTHYKKIFRGYWSAFGQTSTLENQVLRKGKIVKTWQVPMKAKDPVLPAFIQAYTRLRVQEHAAAACHIFNDAVTVPYEIEEGPNDGDWALKQNLVAPITVSGAGNLHDNATYRRAAGTPLMKRG